MKTVTAFIGSGRKKNGLTYRATRWFLDNLESSSEVRGEIVFLSEYELGLCRGCKICFERGEERCPLNGDRDLLIEKMLSSDGIVLASPNYSFQVSSTMKAFLDRLGYVFHRPLFHGKTFTSIVVQGFIGGDKIEEYLRFVGTCLGCNVVKGSCITALEPATEADLRKMNKALARHSRRFRLSSPSRPTSLRRSSSSWASGWAAPASSRPSGNGIETSSTTVTTAGSTLTTSTPPSSGR